VTNQQIPIVEPTGGDVPVEVRPPVPPFTRETATQKVRLALKLALPRSPPELERSRDRMTDSTASMQRFFPTVNISATS
jgi:hypothetical protein